jgi:hypothetical protein
MERVEHYINNSQIYPVNGDEIGFSLDFTGDPKEAELNTDAIVLANDARALVLDHITNGAGIFEGIPYTIKIGSVTLEYFIDLTDNLRINDSSIEVNIKRRKAANYFFYQADALSFELLNKKQPITGMIDVPYVIIKDNQIVLLITLGLTTYSLTQATIEAVRDAAEAVADFVETLPLLPANAGAVIAAGIKAAARIVYAAALIIALINLVTQIIELIFPPVRYFKASYFRQLLAQGCAYLGYNFSSTLLDQYSQLAFLGTPTKDTNKSIFEDLITVLNQPFTKGYPSAFDTTDSLGGMIRALEDWLYAETRIIGNTVYFEDVNFWYTQAGVQIINTLSLQDIREDSYTYNLGEAWQRKYLSYTLDPSDLHTLDKTAEVDAEYHTQLISPVNSDLSTIKGFSRVDVPYALGSRKEKLTFVENIGLGLAIFADAVANIFGANSNLAAQVKGRIGVLQISQQFYRIPKALWVGSNGRQPANYLDIIGADAIYNARHTGSQVKENFKRVYSATIPFSDENFTALLNNNVVTDQNGQQLEILTFEWINEARQAEITYTISASSEANNIETIKIDG